MGVYAICKLMCTVEYLIGLYHVPLSSLLNPLHNMFNDRIDYILICDIQYLWESSY